MNNVNEFVVCKENYEDDYDFKEAIGNIVSLLLENDYTMTIRYDEKGLGIVAIDYEDIDIAYPMWLTPEEIDDVVMARLEKNAEEGE